MDKETLELLKQCRDSLEYVQREAELTLTGWGVREFLIDKLEAVIAKASVATP